MGVVGKKSEFKKKIFLVGRVVDEREVSSSDG